MSDHLLVPDYIKNRDIVPAFGKPDTELFLKVLRDGGFNACLERLGLLDDSVFDSDHLTVDAPYGAHQSDRACDRLLALFDDLHADRNAVELLSHYMIVCPYNIDGSINSGMSFSVLSDAVYDMLEQRITDTSVEEIVTETLCDIVYALSRPIDIGVFSVESIRHQAHLPPSRRVISVIQSSVEHVAEHCVRAVWEHHFSESIDMSMQLQTQDMRIIQATQQAMYASVASSLGIAKGL